MDVRFIGAVRNTPAGTSTSPPSASTARSAARNALVLSVALSPFAPKSSIETSFHAATRTGACSSCTLLPTLLALLPLVMLPTHHAWCRSLLAEQLLLTVAPLANLRDHTCAGTIPGSTGPYDVTVGGPTALPSHRW